MPILGVIDSSKSGNLTPTSGYVSLASTSLSATSLSVTFSNIPTIYRHLELRMFATDQTTNNNTWLRMTFNNNTSAIYAYAARRFTNDTTTLSTAGSTGGNVFGGSTLNAKPATVSQLPFVSSVVRIPLYSSTTAYKNWTGWAGCVYTQTEHAFARFWGSFASTSPITTVTISTESGSYWWVTGSTFSLYGIK